MTKANFIPETRSQLFPRGPLLLKHYLQLPARVQGSNNTADDSANRLHKSCMLRRNLLAKKIGILYGDPAGMRALCLENGEHLTLRPLNLPDCE
jgi:hypothetical protein